MHLHQQSRCMNCAKLAAYSTPIPNILLLSEMCQYCGFNDLVGWNGDILCGACIDMWQDDVAREMHRGLHSSRPTEA